MATAQASSSGAKNGKDLVTMSEAAITQQAEAAVTRINQLTERMLTADKNAAVGLADARDLPVVPPITKRRSS
jgi:hypothetical protein